MAINKNDKGFHVKLDGITLSDASRSRIQAGIQDVVLKELSTHFPTPDGPDTDKPSKFGNGVIVVPPRHWIGIILKPFDGKEDIAGQQIL